MRLLSKPFCRTFCWNKSVNIEWLFSFDFNAQPLNYGQADFAKVLIFIKIRLLQCNRYHLEQFITGTQKPPFFRISI